CQRRKAILQLGRLGPRPFCVAVGRNGGANCPYEVRRLERLGKEVDRASLHRAHGLWNVAVSSEEHDLRMIPLGDLSLEIETVDVWKLHVQDQARWQVGLGICSVLAGGSERDRIQIDARKQLVQRSANRRVIVDYEDDVLLRVHEEGP